MEEIAARGRCTFAMISVTQEKLAQKFPGLDEREDVDVKQVLKRLQKTGANAPFAIIRWFNRVGKAFHNATIDLLRSRGIISLGENCGECNNLTISTPYRCLLTGEEKLKKDPGCEHFSRIKPVVQSLNGAQSNGIGELPNPASDRTEEIEVMYVGNLMAALETRAARAAPGSHQKEVYTRQYNVFVHLLKIMPMVDSKEEALRLVAEQLGVGITTVRGDLEDTRNFFLRKGL